MFVVAAWRTFRKTDPIPTEKSVRDAIRTKLSTETRAFKNTMQASQQMLVPADETATSSEASTPPTRHSSSSNRHGSSTNRRSSSSGRSGHSNSSTNRHQPRDSTSSRVNSSQSRGNSRSPPNDAEGQDIDTEQ